MPTSQSQACQDKAKSHIMNNLLTSNTWSLRENLNPEPCHVDWAIAMSKLQALGLRFSCKDCTLGLIVSS